MLGFISDFLSTSSKDLRFPHKFLDFSRGPFKVLSVAENGIIFRRVREPIYYRKTAKTAGEIVTGVWERVELLERLGADRVEALERAGIIEDCRALR